MWRLVMNNNDYFHNAINLYEQNLYADALSECNIAIELDSFDDRAYTLRGMSYYSMEQIENALEDFTTAIQLNPYNSEAYCYRGMCFSISKSAVADSVISFDKPSAFNLKGLNLDNETIQNLLQALEDENIAIKLDNSNLQAYLTRATILFWLETYEQSLIDLNKVIKECPNESAFE